MAVRTFRMRRLGLALAAVSLTTGWVPSAWSDTIVMTNGDRLTGEVLLMDSGTLVLNTDYAGEIRVSWDKVAQLQTDDPMLLRAQGLPAGYEARLAPTERPGSVAAVTSDDGAANSTQMELVNIERIVRPHAFLRDWSFEGGIDVAMDATHASGSNQNWNAALRATARRDWWRHNLDMDYVRKTQDSVVGTYNYNAAYSVDRFLSEKLFLRGRVRYGRDNIDNPSRQLVFAAGPGYQFWDDELGAFSVSAFLTHTRYKYHDAERDNFQTAGLGWNFTRYLAGKQWQVFTTGEVHRALSSSSLYSLEAELGLRYSVTQWMSLYAKTSYNHIALTGRSSTNERRYSLGLGVHW